jgi:hypothetical protein
MQDHILYDAHLRQWKGERLCCIAKSHRIPEGTLKARLMEWREAARLESPYQVRRRVIERALRHGDGPATVRLHLWMEYQLQYSFPAIIEAMKRMGWKEEDQPELFHVRSGSTQVNSEV